MSYWNEVKEILAKGVGMAKEGIKEEAEKIADKTKEGVDITKAKAKLYVKRRDFQNLLADLGDLFYIAYKESKDVYQDEDIKELINHINEVEAECKALEKEASL